MNQKSNFASSWLLNSVQFTAAAALVVGIFVVSTQNSDKPHQKSLTVETITADHRPAGSNNYDSSMVAHAHYQTDGSSSSDSQLTIKQCRFDDETWDAPATDFSPLGSTPSGLGWGSDVEENGMGVTAPLSIKPSPTRLMDRIRDFNKANERRIERVAQLPTELLQLSLIHI